MMRWKFLYRCERYTVNITLLRSFWIFLGLSILQFRQLGLRNKKGPKNVPESSQTQNCHSFVQIQGTCARYNVFRRLNVVENPRTKDILFEEVQLEQCTKYLFRLLQTILTQSHWFNYCLLQWLVQTKRLILISCSEQTTSVYRVVVIYFWLLLLVWKLV